LGIFSNGQDIPQVVDRMLEIANDPIAYNRIRETGYEVIKQNFDASVVIPETLDKIFALGRDVHKVENDEELLTSLVDSAFSRGVKELENSGRIPVLGIKEILDKQLFFLEGWKQVPYNTNKSTSLF
jgi:hypothetical protein